MSYVKPLKLTEKGFTREIAASEDVELGNISLGGAISASSATISGAMSADSATISGSVSASNFSGDLSGNVTGYSAVLSGNLYVPGGESTFASATVLDLTSGRLVFAGADGALVDDSGLTYNSATDALTVVGNVSAGNLSGSLVEASSGMIAPTFSGDLSGNVTGYSAVLSGNLYVSGGESTFASATVSDLAATELVFAGSGGALDSSADLTWDGSDLKVGNVSVGADGVISGLSEPSDAQDAATKAYVDSAASGVTLTAGDGIDITSQIVSVDLATSDPGLEFDGDKLAVLLNGSTLSKASGLSVLGLPSAFTIAGSVVSSSFTATNANILVGGSSTDAGHASSLITLNNLAAWNFTADSAGVAQYKPVYISSGSKVAEAQASSATQGWVIGVAMDSAASGNQVKVITAGVAPSAISGLGASAGDPIYLNSAGGFTKDPANHIGSGERFVMVGLAINSNDLFVQVRDFGQKA